MQSNGNVYSKRNNWSEFTKEEHDVWSVLYNQQYQTLQGIVPEFFFKNLYEMNIASNEIPKIDELNESLLQQSGGMSLIFDNETIVGRQFFDLLSKGKFPSTMFIRTRENIDYVPEPDIFHDVFGHVPFLAERKISHIVKLFGKIGLECLEQKISTKFIGRLYWYTIEFGLIKDGERNKIFGAGLASSKTESIFSVSDASKKIPLDPELAMTLSYDYNSIQKIYFVIESVDFLIDYLENFNVEILFGKKFLSDVDTASLRIDEIKC